MALAFDASASGAATANTALTYSHTVGAGSDRILYVGISFFAAGAIDDITTVTYAGVSMTQIAVKARTGANQQVSYLYYLVNPASGANDVVINKSAGNVDIRAASASYTGAAQAGQPDSSNTGEADATSITLATTTVADNCWVVSFAMNSNAQISAGTGTTARNTTQVFCGIGDSNAVKTPPGSYSMQWTETPSSAGWTMVMASILPKEAEPAPVGGFIYMSV